MRLNIFHVRYCFGFYCLDLVILWENMKVIKDNISSKLSKFEKQNCFKGVWLAYLANSLERVAISYDT